MNVYSVINCPYEREGKPLQITGAQQSGKGHGAPICCICFCFSW